MNWFRLNKFIGSFLLACALATLGAGYFLLHEKWAADEQEGRLNATLNERNRLRASHPFPDPANLQKARIQADNYRDLLGALETELKDRALPVVPLLPNEFQAQLRQAVNAITEDAAASKVQLPANFFLGFDEYATSLPNSAAAPLLGQELQAIAFLATRIVNAHVDVLNSLTRTPLPEEKPAPAATPARKGRGPREPAVAAPALVSAHTVEIAFSASPAAARKVLNQVATAKEQLFIIRTLQVKNQVDKGPSRVLADTPAIALPAAAVAAPGRRGASAAPAINFIVGSEHLEMKARIDIISLNPEKETR